jgi:hypothetical protein
MLAWPPRRRGNGTVDDPHGDYQPEPVAPPHHFASPWPREARCPGGRKAAENGADGTHQSLAAARRRDATGPVEHSGGQVRGEASGNGTDHRPRSGAAQCSDPVDAWLSTLSRTGP